MKSLSTIKPLMIIVVGLPGSGKSFFARQFSETFGAPRVSNDRLRHILFGSEGYSKQEQTTIGMVAEAEIHELLKTQKTFLVDGFGLGRTQRAVLRKLAKEHGYDVLLVWVQTDQATAKYRSMKRSNKKKDDEHNASLTSALFEQETKKFSAPATNENHVVISGKHTYATQAKVVLKRLIQPRESSRTITNHGERSPDAQQPRRNVIIR